MKVVNRPRWTRTKVTLAGIVALLGIGLIGGLEGEAAIPSTWFLGIIANAVAVRIVWTCRPEDF